MKRALRGQAVLIELDRHRVCAVQVLVSRSGVKVQRVCSSPCPEGVSQGTASQVGAWLKTVLREAGIGAQRALFAVSRGEVVLKILELPRSGIETEAEVCEAVRFQLARQLTMPMTDAVIDSIDLSPQSDSGTLSVLAGAIHKERLGWYASVAESAGLKIAGLQLRSGGIATLTEREGGPVLVVAPGPETTEFVVASKGRVLFARLAEWAVTSGEASLPLLRDEPEQGGGGDDESARRVAVEAKRTWMSYRVSQRAEDLESIIVLGEGTEAEQIRARCHAMLEIPARCSGLPERVAIRPEVDEQTQATILPLLGLALRAGAGAGGLDFADPRKPPDVGAGRRQLVLASILGVIVVGGAGYLWAQNQLASLKDRESALTDELNALNLEYRAFLGELARAEHIKRWDSADPDWVGHIAWLSDRMPDPAQSQADRFLLILGASIRYEGTAFPGGQWSTNTSVATSISGKVTARQMSLDLRERLLGERLHTVFNRGADVADRYDLELVTNALRLPRAATEESAGGGS